MTLTRKTTIFRMMERKFKYCHTEVCTLRARSSSSFPRVTRAGAAVPGTRARTADRIPGSTHTSCRLRGRALQSINRGGKWRSPKTRMGMMYRVSSCRIQKFNRRNSLHPRRQSKGSKGKEDKGDGKIHIGLHIYTLSSPRRPSCSATGPPREVYRTITSCGITATRPRQTLTRRPRSRSTKAGVERRWTGRPSGTCASGMRWWFGCVRGSRAGGIISSI